MDAVARLPAGDPFKAPGLVAATAAEDRLFVVRLVSTEAFELDAGGTEWRSLGPSGVERFRQPVGVAAGRWLLAGIRDDGTNVAATLDLQTGQWADTQAPTGITVGYLGAGAGAIVVAMAARWSQDDVPPLALSWDPVTDTWTELSPPPLADRAEAAVAWTGRELLVWGGAQSGGFGGPSFADGAALAP